MKEKALGYVTYSQEEQPRKPRTQHRPRRSGPPPPSWSLIIR